MKIDVVYIGSITNVADEIAISDDFNLVGVIIEKSKISKGILKLAFTRDCRIVQVFNKKTLESAMSSFNNVVYIISGFGIILSEAMLNDKKVFNIHPGDLPEYKGRHPIFYAIANGERSIGFTLHVVTKKIDAGRIIAKSFLKLPFDKGEDYIMANYNKPVNLLLPKLKLFIDKKLEGIENIGGNYYSKVTLEKSAIYPEQKSSLILNIIRAQSMYNGGIVTFQGEKTGVLEADIESIENLKYDHIFQNILVRAGKPIAFKIDDTYAIHFVKTKNVI